MATVSGAGVPILALQQSRDHGSCFFSSSADQTVSRYNLKGIACGLLEKVHLNACAVALETLPAKLVCGEVNGNITILCEVRAGTFTCGAKDIMASTDPRCARSSGTHQGIGFAGKSASSMLHYCA